AGGIQRQMLCSIEPPRPFARSVRVGEHGLRIAVELERPPPLPAEPVEGARIAFEVRRQRDDAAAECETAAPHPVDEGDEGEAGLIKPASPSSPSSTGCGAAVSH